MKASALLGAAAAAALTALGPTPAAAFDCHVALVLALDASDSVDPREADLQRRGVALALRDPAVRAAFTPGPGVGAMLMVFEWADPGEVQTLLPWSRLDGPAALDAAAARMEALPSVYMAGQTGIGAALDHAARAFDRAGAACARRVIDVSGDGPGNVGATPELYRRLGVFKGITINGLVIRHPALDSAQPPGRDPLPYYTERVRHGPGAFVMEIADYEDYARGIRAKLLRELAPSLARAE